MKTSIFCWSIKLIKILIVLALPAACGHRTDTEPQRAAFLEGAPNFRDLGGYRMADNRKTAWRKLFRSQTLAQLTDSDLAKLHEMGIKTVIDFRDNDEADHAPSRWPEGVTVICLPIGVGSANDSSALRMQYLMSGEADSLDAVTFMEDANRRFATEFAQVYRQFFSILARHDVYPVVFHCTAGKDRTGFAAAMVLSALGADWDTVLNDYLLTNTYLKPQATASAQVPALPMSVLRQMWGVRPSYLNAARDEITAQYGSVDHYLKQALGVGEIEKAALKKYLLQP